LSILILLVALWIQKPVDFSSFPTVLLVATMLRLALNVATTRLILTHGAEGDHAAGYIISGFATLVMGNDFMIGVVVFLILVTINFIVITKGATRIAEVGARFTLDAIPGKQRAIDADLSAGLINEKDAQRRRKELEEESSFYGSMDGASKFVRGDAIAGLLILAVNIFGGVAIGCLRHGMAFSDALNVFTKLSIGDGLVSQIPALIVSLAAGLLVSKGGATGAAEKAVTGQLAGYPKAMLLAAAALAILSFVPSLPFVPFAALSGLLGISGWNLYRRINEDDASSSNRSIDEPPHLIEAKSLRNDFRVAEIELQLGARISSTMFPVHNEIALRVSKMRRKFAQQFGFLLPEVQLFDSHNIPADSYQIRVHGVTVGIYQLRLGNILVISDCDRLPDYPGDVTKDPAFNLDAMWVPDSFSNELRSNGFKPIDPLSVMLTHLNETLKSNLPQLLSYKSIRVLLGELDLEYKKLLDDICPSHISYSGIQAVLKLLLAERVSIRNLPLILESIAEIAPHVRRAELVAEHVRTRLSQQICGDLAPAGSLNIIRLGSRWDSTFHQALKRDQKGEVVEFDFEPRLLEQFGREVSDSVRPRLDAGEHFAVVCAGETRPYVRMVVERLFPNVPILSHSEIGRSVQISLIGTLS
jgi:flagellar biosynthesis protein FlhA